MKKIFTLLLAVSLFSSLSAQTYCEDFEGFSIGDPIGETSPIWTTWGASANPGLNPPYGDDVAVDGTQANSGSNSLYLTDATGNGGPQDIILPLGGVWDLGQFELTMQMYVSNGTGAYFNFQEVAQAGISWAMDCMLDSQGNMTFSTGGGATTFLTTSYPFDTWFEIKMEIDLTTNYWEVFIDSISQGYFSNPINQIASLNLYPTAQTDFWVDDVCMSITPYVLTNMNGATNSITTIEGLAGQSKFPSVDVRNLGLTDITSFDVTVGYNGSIVTENITGINLPSLATMTVDFTQSITLAGGMQNLTATLENLNGNAIDDDPSDDSQTISVNSVTPAAGKLVIGEEATGTWCGWCPRGAVALDWMEHDYHGYFQGIAVHNGDPMTVTDYDAAIGNFIGGYPSGLVDRGSEIDPSNFKGDFLQRITAEPSGTIINGAELNGTTLNVSLTASFDQEISGNWALACVLIEDSVTGMSSGYSQSNSYGGGGAGPLVGPDGTDWATLPSTVPFTMMVYNHVARAISPGWDGETITSNINAGDTYNTCFEFTLDGSWNVQKMKIVGMLINNSGLIDNGSSSTIADAVNNGFNSCSSSSIENVLFDGPTQLALFPNPTSENTTLGIRLEETTDITITLRNITGQIVLNEVYRNVSGIQTIDVRTKHLSAGLYSVEVQHNGKTQLLKLTIN
tara:strand:+ start:6435 stop:8480 length:2046 start_codon:yes stop_codon:yes gene_type:complete